MNSLGRIARRWWWIVVAIVVAAIFLAAGIDNLVGAYAPLPEAAAQCFVCVALIVGGVLLRMAAPRTGAALVALGAFPAVLVWWAWPLVLLGAAVVIGAGIEVVRLSAPSLLARIGAAVGVLLLGGAALVSALGFPQASAMPPVVAIGLTLLVLGVAAVLLFVTRDRQPRASDARLTPA